MNSEALLWGTTEIQFHTWWPSVLWKLSHTTNFHCSHKRIRIISTSFYNFPLSYKNKHLSTMNKPPEFTDKCCLSFVLCLVFQLCPTLCDSIDCSLPSSSVHGDSPGKILEWVAISSSRGSSQPRGLNPGLPHCRCILYRLSHQGSPPPFFFFGHLSPLKSIWEYIFHRPTF